jgi:lysophospholipid acyltransferase (LPLAT)-like uncharacterized protein
VRLIRRGSRAEWAFVRAGGVVLHVLLRLLGWTTRKRYVGAEELLECFARDERVIMAFWHGRMIMMPFAYRGRRACVMNSQHRDGELISRALRPFGVEVVRGSSTRGWVGGMKGLLEAYRRGCDLVVVPDGPRGPRCRAKSGVIQLARATAAPVYTVSYSATRVVRLKSWDGLFIPFPFARVTYVVDEPIRVPRDVAADEMEHLRVTLERRLNRASTRADIASGIALRQSAEYIPTAPVAGEAEFQGKKTKGETKGERAMGRFLAMVLIVVMSGGVGVSPAWGKKAKAASKATSADDAVAEAKSNAERADQLAKTFGDFCLTWMDKLRAREKYNVEHIEWQTDAAGVSGEYVGYDTDHVNTVAHTAKKEVPIGKLVYKELKLKLVGKSEADALAQKPQIIEQTEITELFRYDRGIWVY